MCAWNVKRVGMGDGGSSVTLIFYSIDSNWWRGTEPLLNLIAAAAQFSSFTHVEMAIGETAGACGEMSNVLRVFNDSTGVVSYAHHLYCIDCTILTACRRPCLPTGAYAAHRQEPAVFLRAGGMF